MNHHEYLTTPPTIFARLPRNFGPCEAKYAFIDFGESLLVQNNDDAMRLPDEMRVHGNAAAPELLKDDPVNVFPCDVYALGAMFKEQIEHEKHFASTACLG